MFAKISFFFPSCLRSRLAFRLKETRFYPPAELRCVPFPSLRAACITCLKQSCCSEERGPRETRRTSLTRTSRPKHKVVSNPRTCRHHTGSNCVQITLETGGGNPVFQRTGTRWTDSKLYHREIESSDLNYTLHKPVPPPRMAAFACSHMSAAVVLLETRKTMQ